MMPPKVSIIVPVFKVERYIRRCIESILQQTMKNIEVILVDDGSPDMCGIICDEYANKDKRIKVIHKENAGVSAARNSGLDIAAGDYIGFVDSDDYVAPNMFELLYQRAKISDADIAMCEFALTNGEQVDLFHKVTINDGEFCVFNKKEAFEMITDFSRNVQVAVWNKLYKRERIQELRFDTDKRMAEDIEFLMKAISKSERIVYLPVALYGYYAQRAGAATSHADHDIDWYVESYRNVSQIMDDFGRMNPSMKNLAIAYKCVNGDMTIANAMVRAGNLDKARNAMIRADIWKNMGPIFMSKLHTYKKMQMLVFLVSPGLYKVFMRKKLT